MPWSPRARQLAWVKAGVFVACLIPLSRLVYGGVANSLGAFPAQWDPKLGIHVT